MKIADGLILQKDIAEETARLRQLATQESWGYRSTTSVADAKWIANFDLEENHKRVKQLSKLHRKISRAISKANSTVDLDLNDSDYSEWL